MPSNLPAPKQAFIIASKKIRSEPDHLHQLAFDSSLQPNIIFIVHDGSVIRANVAACKLLGYSSKELLTKKRSDIFSLSESSYKKMIRQRNTAGCASADLSIIKKNGKLVPCAVTSVIFKDDNGISNSILTIVNMEPRLLKQKKIDAKNEKAVASDKAVALSRSNMRQAQNNEWITSITRTSYDVIWSWDIISNHITFGNNYEDIFGYKLPKNRMSLQDWINRFPPGERRSMQKKISSIFNSDSNSWKNTYQFTSPDGSIGHVVSRANIVRDNDGKPTRMIGVIHDLSKVQKLEGILEEEIRAKEKQIIEAILDAKEVERCDLGKELHDNINQLLGASTLYLDMARNDMANGEIYLMHCAEYTSTAIEEIRKLSKGLVTDSIREFGLAGSIEQMRLDIMNASCIKIHCKLDDSQEDKMSDKFKLNIFRICQEQLNNIVKHAKAAHVYITFSKNDTGLILSIRDDGIGFDTSRKKGTGLSNIVSRAELYKGNASFISEAGKSCILVVSFPSIC